MMATARQAAIQSNDGKLKLTIVDPVMVGGAVSSVGKTTKWVPILPATDSALAMAIIRWIIENKRYNALFLSSPTLDAAKKKGFNSYTNAAYLVITDPEHPKTRRLLRAADVGLAGSDAEQKKDGNETFAVIDKTTQKLVPFSSTTEAELFFKGEIFDKDGKAVKVETAFSLLWESAMRFTLAEYAEACGIPEKDIIDIAREFTAHGTKAGVDGLGSTAAANGMDATHALYLLNALIGSVNKKGGLIMRRMAYPAVAGGPQYDLVNFAGQPKKQGIGIGRNSAYEKTSEYKNRIAKGEKAYPSRLPWHAAVVGADNQALFSLVNGYPYQAKILMNWMANPLFTTPAGARKEVVEAIKNPARVPLFISFDAFMGEMTALADYVIPDTTPYESWGLPNMEGNFSGKVTGLRWPVVQPITAKLDNQRFACFENYIIDAAKMMKLPGFGENAIADKDKKLHVLNRPEDFFLRAAANAAFSGTPLPAMSSAESQMQDIDGAVAPWKSSLKPEEWPHVAYMLSRGGRFEAYGEGFEGENHKYGYTGCFNVYAEMIATARNSITGEFFPGIIEWNPERFADGRLLSKVYPKEQWPFKGVSYKAKLRSNSMSVNSSILLSMSPTNYIEINPEDATRLGFKNGDRVKIISASGGEAVGTLQVRQGIAKGVVAVAFGYGHWEYGARAHNVAGKDLGGDSRRAQGVLLSGISLIDPTFKDIYGFSDMPSGAPARNGGAFRLEKV
jgi:tetrathionate reductase subunit A